MRPSEEPFFLSCFWMTRRNTWWSFSANLARVSGAALAS